MEIHMSEFMKSVLHWISMSGTFLILFGFLTLIQMFTIGLLFNLNDLTIGDFPIASFVYMLISILIIKKFFTISSPYKK